MVRVGINGFGRIGRLAFRQVFGAEGSGVVAVNDLTSPAMLATLLSVISSWGFSFYVDNFGNFNKIYGSIGTLIVLMIWIQLNCMILLIGFELNAGIAVLRDERLLQQAETHIK